MGVGQYVASERHLAALGPVRTSSANRAVLIHGGKGQTALGNFPPDSITWACVDAKVPVLYADYGGTTSLGAVTWGNDTSRTRIGQLWSFAQSGFGAKSDKVVLYGASMGSLVVLSYAIANPANVAAIACVLPLANLSDVHDNNRDFQTFSPVAIGTTSGSAAVTVPGGSADATTWPDRTIQATGIPNWTRITQVNSSTSITISQNATATGSPTATIGGFAASIENAYGGSAGYASAVGTRDPSLNEATLSAIPMKLWYSSNDPVCLASQATAFASATGATAVNMGALGHSAVGYTAAPGDEVETFLKAYA